MEMLNVKVNGIAVSVPKGATILEAARAAGVWFPKRSDCLKCPYSCFIVFSDAFSETNMNCPSDTPLLYFHLMTSGPL